MDSTREEQLYNIDLEALFDFNDLLETPTFAFSEQSAMRGPPVATRPRANHIQYSPVYSSRSIGSSPSDGVLTPASGRTDAGEYNENVQNSWNGHGWWLSPHQRLDYAALDPSITWQPMRETIMSDHEFFNEPEDAVTGLFDTMLLDDGSAPMLQPPGSTWDHDQLQVPDRNVHQQEYHEHLQGQLPVSMPVDQPWAYGRTTPHAVQYPVYHHTQQPIAVVAPLQQPTAAASTRPRQRLTALAPAAPSQPRPSLASARSLQQQSIPPSPQNIAMASSGRIVRSTRNIRSAVGLSNSASRSAEFRRGVRRQPLGAEQREQVSAMRQVGACWRCVFQRDTCKGCNDGVCDRCSKARSERPDNFFLPCDRTKLPMYIQDFLPASMQLIHQKQTIEDEVHRQIRSWHQIAVSIPLTPGFGPDFIWAVHEFVPTSPQALINTQYLMNQETRQMQCYDNYSPPFAILRLGQQEKCFEEYLDTLLDTEGRHLRAFAEAAYCSTEYETFQQETLTLLCELYISTGDIQLRDVLKKVLRLLILTYIMTHVLNIPDDRLAGVLDQLQYTRVPSDKRNQKHTVPRLAMRQLKFYFAMLREQTQAELLKYSQNMLRAKNKDETWLQVFVIILGFAMVLEEVQEIMHIQAMGDINKSSMNAEEAHTRAMNACERIDRRFELLIALFQHKYRSDKWTSQGSFGNQTPRLSDLASTDFLHRLRRLILENQPFLERAKNIPLGHENQCDYTTRLVAKFLVPFTRLPEGGN